MSWHGCSLLRRTHRALSVREVFLSLDFPPGIITSRSAQIRDYSPDCRGDRTKSARACGTSAEEIFLTARCHRVRPTEITDEDSERSSTPVTVQERAGGRFPSYPREHYRVGLNKQKGEKNDFDRKYNRRERYTFEFGARSHLEICNKRPEKKLMINVEFKVCTCTYAFAYKISRIMLDDKKSTISTSIECKLYVDYG